MDYVYICREGDNEELRYSIRSVVANATHDKIWVIGYKPDWYIGNYIQIDNIGSKFENITNCHKILPDIGALSEEFVIMNDDFFILKPLGKMPTFSDGTLTDKIEKNMISAGLSKYVRALITAKKRLHKLGITDPINYDLHTPMVFNKALLASVDDLTLSPRSLYGNLFKIDSIMIDDVKIHKKGSPFDIDESHFISTEDDSFYLIKDKLEQLFPNKTIYEKE
jgi:hypothetical protein